MEQIIRLGRDSSRLGDPVWGVSPARAMVTPDLVLVLTQYQAHIEWQSL